MSGMGDIHHRIDLLTEHHARLLPEIDPAGVEPHILGHMLGRLWRPAVLAACLGVPLAVLIARTW